MKTMKILSACFVFGLLVAHSVKAQTSIPSNTLTGTQTAPPQFLGSSSNHDVIFKSFNVERFRIVQLDGSLKLTTTTNLLGAASGVKILGAIGNTATSPAYSFNVTGESGLGMYRPTNSTIAFSSAGLERMRILSNGNIGVSTTNPLAKFSVQSTTSINDIADDLNGLSIQKQTTATKYRSINFYPHLYGGAYKWLTLAGDFGFLWTDGNGVGGGNSSAGMVFGPRTATNDGMRITAEGNVGIGTSLVNNPNNYKLAVNGTIGAKAVKVEIASTTWPDYVFEKNYSLKSLREVENFILLNKHLPNIPPAKEIETEGIDLAAMNAKLLEKIEELTLHLIAQDKRIEQLENK